MAQSTVTAVTGNGTFDSNYGTLYKFDYEFADGTILTANHKTKDGAFKVGELLEYEITKEHPQYGKSGKVGKPKDVNAPQGKPANTTQPPATDWRKKDIAIIMQNSFTQANSFLNIVGFDHKEKDKCLQQLMDYADLIAQHVIKKSGI